MISPYRKSGASLSGPVPGMQSRRAASHKTGTTVSGAAERIMRLHQTVGNRMVQTMIEGRNTGSPRPGIVQRGKEQHGTDTSLEKDEVERQCREIIRNLMGLNADEETVEQQDEEHSESKETEASVQQEAEDPDAEIKKIVAAYNEKHTDDPIDADELVERLMNEIMSENVSEGAEQLIEGRLENNSFRITAGLTDYAKHFGEPFVEHLFGLTDKQRWLDGGAGEARAMQEYYKDSGQARTTAIGYKKPESVDLQELEKNEKFQYASGKYFGEMSGEDLGMDQGLFDVITDYNGVLSYTKTLSEDLQKYLNLLTKGGALYTSFFAGIENSSVDEWLASIQGVTIEKAGKEALKIVKTADVVEVPPLENTAYEEIKHANIPDRTYRLADSQ